MSVPTLKHPYILQTFNFSHSESDGAKVYIEKQTDHTFKLMPNGVLQASLWCQTGPVLLNIREAESVENGSVVQIPRNESEALVFTRQIPLWLAIFNLESNPLIFVPLHQKITPFRSLHRLYESKETQEERGLKNQSLCKRYHIIVPSRPGKTPAPRPASGTVRSLGLAA